MIFNNKAIVITLQKNPERRQNATEQMTHAGFDEWHFYESIYCKGMGVKPETDKIGPGKLGCGMAHYNCWNFARMLGGCFVFEDDFIWKQGATGRKKVLEDAPPGYDFYYLGAYNVHELFKHGTNDCKPVTEFWQILNFPLCLHSYYITSDGATKLINHYNKIGFRNHTDVNLADARSAGVYKSIACVPRLAEQQWTRFKSDLMINKQML